MSDFRLKVHGDYTEQSRNATVIADRHSHAMWLDDSTVHRCSDRARARAANPRKGRGGLMTSTW